MAWKCSGTELWSHHSMKLLKPRHRRRLLARPCCSCHSHSQTLAGTAGTGSAPGHWAWTSAQSRARGESAPRPPKPVTHAQWFPGNLLSLAFLPSLVTLETRAGCSVLPMFPTLPKSWNTLTLLFFSFNDLRGYKKHLCGGDKVRDFRVA